MRDPTRREYGDLARLAHAFVRSQPDVVCRPPLPAAAATFNILMVICRPGGPRGDVPFQSVARPLLELFRPHRDRIRLDVLRPTTCGHATIKWVAPARPISVPIGEPPVRQSRRGGQWC
jgi:hypothetical protein